MELADISVDLSSCGEVVAECARVRALDSTRLIWGITTPLSKPGCPIVRDRCSAQSSVYPSGDLDCPALGTDDYDQ